MKRSPAPAVTARRAGEARRGPDVTSRAPRCEDIGWVGSQPANVAGKPDPLLLHKKKKVKKEGEKEKIILTSLSS